LERFEALIHRLHDWKESLGDAALEVSSFVGPSFDYDLATLEAVRRMRARSGWKMEILNLGGQKMRADNELTQWLDERHSSGIIGFHASFAGLDAVHDKWNNRAGDFSYQTSILRRGGALGMVRHERLFLAKNTIGVMDQLLDVLETIPGQSRDRYAVPFFYAGTAARYERERIDESDRDHLPARVKHLRLWHFDTWRSEREWLPRVKEAAHVPKNAMLHLDVDESNIELLESLTCEAIFDLAKKKFLADWASIPDIEQLCDQYGDPTGLQIYSSAEELETKLIDLYRRENRETVHTL
jgi:hypothetical protein